MQIEYITFMANAMQLSVVVMSFIAYVPQWLKLIRSKSSQDISLSAWLLWALSALFAVFYAVVEMYQYGVGWALIISAVSSLVFIVITVVLIVIYRNPRK